MVWTSSFMQYSIQRAMSNLETDINKWAGTKNLITIDLLLKIWPKLACPWVGHPSKPQNASKPRQSSIVSFFSSISFPLCGLLLVSSFQVQNTILIAHSSTLLHRVNFGIIACWFMEGKAYDVKRLGQEPFCLRDLLASSDSKTNFKFLKRHNEPQEGVQASSFFW